MQKESYFTPTAIVLEVRVEQNIMSDIDALRSDYGTPVYEIWG